MNRLREINKEIVEDYDHVYGNYDEYYDEGKDYGGQFSRQAYNILPEVNENFERYKNMFDSENSYQSHEEIDQKIDGFSDWFKNSKFGEDLNLPENDNFDTDPLASKRPSEFHAKHRIIDPSVRRNSQRDNNNNAEFDGRSFKEDNNRNVNGVLSKTESNSVPYYAHPSATPGGMSESVPNNPGNNLVQMKMSNNNLKVRLLKNLSHFIISA